MVGGGTVPATNFTRHDVQRPRPPQIAVMSMPRGVRRVEDGRAGFDVEDAATGKNGQDKAHSGLRIPLPP